MPRRPRVPRDLRLLPFDGGDAVRRGLITRAELRGKSWRRMLPRVYMTAAVEPDCRMWCRAAWLYAGTGSAICGVSAALMHGIDLPRDKRICLALPPGKRIAAQPRLRIVRSMLSAAETMWVSGVPVTTPARTCFDLGRALALEQAVAAIDEFCFRRLTTVAAIRAVADAHRRWPGSAQLARVLGLVEPKSESPWESRLRLVMVLGGLPRPVAQYDVRAGDRLVARLDLAYPQWKIAIEYDGDHHRERDAFVNDLRRQNALLALGWVILRFTAADVLRNPRKLIETIQAVIPH